MQVAAIIELIAVFFSSLSIPLDDGGRCFDCAKQLRKQLTNKFAKSFLLRSSQLGKLLLLRWLINYSGFFFTFRSDPRAWSVLVAIKTCTFSTLGDSPMC